MARVLPGYREQAKERIINDSFPVFIEHGYHGTTMDEIAEHLNISKGTLYLYFRNKEELFREIAAALRTRTREDLWNLLRQEEIPMTPRAIFDFFMDASEGYDAIAFEITAAAVHDKALREILEEDTREDIILCEEFLEQLKGRGILKRSADTRVLAGAMIAMFLGLYGLIHFGISRDEAIRAWDGMFGEWMVEG